VLQRHGLDLNTGKYRSTKRGQRHYVTGLSVTDADRPRVPRKLKKRLLQELHFVEKFGLAEHCSKLTGSPNIQNVVNRIEGTVSYIAGIERHPHQPLWARWAAICEHEQVRKSFRARPFEKLRDAVWLVDESELESPRGKCLAIICAEPFDVARAKSALSEFVRVQSERVFLPADKATKLKKQGAHWAELDEGQRTDFVDVLATLSIRAVVAFVPVGDDYRETYLRMLDKVVTQKMYSADDAEVTILVERNPRVAADQVKETILGVHQRLTDLGKRRPLRAPSVLVQSKEESDILAFADALLGVLNGYVVFEGRTPTAAFVRFKQLALSFQLVFDEAREKVWRGMEGLQPFSLMP
jgi:hypothetical protein